MIICSLTKLNVVNGRHSKCPRMGTSWKQGAAHAWCSSTCRLSRMQDPLEATEHHGPARKFFFFFRLSPPSLGRCDWVCGLSLVVCDLSEEGRRSKVRAVSHA